MRPQILEGTRFAAKKTLIPHPTQQLIVARSECGNVSDPIPSLSPASKGLSSPQLFKHIINSEFLAATAKLRFTRWSDCFALQSNFVIQVRNPSHLFVRKNDQPLG